MILEFYNKIFTNSGNLDYNVNFNSNEENDETTHFVYMVYSGENEIPKSSLDEIKRIFSKCITNPNIKCHLVVIKNRKEMKETREINQVQNWR